MRRRLALVVLAVLLTGCGGDEQREQLRPGELTLLSARVAELRAAVLAGDRYAALDAVVAVRETVNRLRPRLAADEEEALRVAVRRLAARIRTDIAPPAEEPEDEESLLPEPAAKPDKPGKGRGKGKGRKKGKGGD